MTIDELIVRMEHKATPAREEDVAALEKRLGTALPDDYRKFLADTNGGFLGGSPWFQGIDQDGESVEAGLHHVAGFRKESHFSINEILDAYEGRIPADLLFIHDDPFGNAICLGLVGDSRGKVYFWDHEEEPWEDEWEGSVENAENITLLANSFTEYVDGVGEMPED